MSTEPPSTVLQPVRARCGLGGPVPCFDDLCHGVDQTLCRLELGFDFCEHGFIPETCPDCQEGEDDWLA